MIVAAKITSKGQITLPREVRKLLAVDTGSVVIFETEGDPQRIQGSAEGPQTGSGL
jgi:AbrB family looped-hinge helix DNA binding protein